MTEIFTHTIDSSLGPLQLFATDAGLRALYLPNHQRALTFDSREAAEHPVIRATQEQLEQYFAGERTEFDLPLDPLGTPFQRQVWSALREIPLGETRTYLEIAVRLGNPRSVGAANGRNPISIIVPCHRVIGSSGALTGYAGGENAKRWLLNHERSFRDRSGFALTSG